MKLKRGLQTFCIALAITFFATLSNAATYSITIDGLDRPGDPVDVFGLTFWMDVAPDFSFTSITDGNAIPASITLGWQRDADRLVGNGSQLQLRFGTADYDKLFMDTPNPLLNGTIFTIEYEGAIEGFDLIQFSDAGGNNLYGDDPFTNDDTPITLMSMDANGANFAVPIPGAVWLLGSGLAGLVAIRRKKNNK